MDGKAEISLEDLINVRVAIRSCAEALSISGEHKAVIAALMVADETLRRAMYKEE